MFTKILIANRGEIACRIIKTAQRMGIRTVAIFSDADSQALHVAMADEAVHIGASPSRDSYLQKDRVIAAAIKTGAQAIHPGYGFLSENAQFCQQCIDNKLVFIGPPRHAIEAMGSKSAAKTIMGKAAVPLVPGYHGEDQNPAILKQAADEMGYPVLLKAAAGGGGKGMRQVHSAAEFDQALAAAKRESLNAFNDDNMLVEKYLTEPRHVEIQIFCDQQGNAVYLAERDCSIQRRHQKVIEEAPAPGMTEALRQQMGTAAISAAKAINYEGAGTVEFLLDKDGSFYFMEMNTRLQVEHPVTEMITGQDLVEWQLRVAAGEDLPLQQSDIKINGHAFEARIYAEDPDNDFLPVTGTLSYVETPVENAHIRVDSGVRQGDEVSVHYDPMIAKLIVWDENRDRALKRLSKALSEYRIKGMTTNINFLYNLSSCTPFAQADLDTGFIEKHHHEIFHHSEKDINADIPLAALFLILKQQQQAQQQAVHSTDPHSPWHHTNAWRLNEAHSYHLSLHCHSQKIEVEVEYTGQDSHQQYRIHFADQCVIADGHLTGSLLTSTINGYRSRTTIAEHDDEYSLYKQDYAFTFGLIPDDIGESNTSTTDDSLNAPMNGTIVELLVELNSPVKQDQALLIMEAMKMEHTIRAPYDGTVQEFYYQAGNLVDGGAELMAFEKKSV
ncbi:MAG TPA: acetyl/propionyl/methylcrotonyl-CoA carboxylase subunit alpha [Porticoccus sp.]|nr:acetyl/propionyl/methylcrotonyl-CoA carboxylase subunit alpha [Porticoccus sp.]